MQIRLSQEATAIVKTACKKSHRSASAEASYQIENGIICSQPIQQPVAFDAETLRRAFRRTGITILSNRK